MSELPLYLDVEGQKRPRRDWDFHHVIPRSSANSNGQRDFINLVGLRIPMFREWHNQGATALHGNVELAPMPNKQLRHIIRLNLYESVGENVYDRFMDVNSQVQAIAECSRNVGLAQDAGRLAINLQQQMPYILNGQVREL